jgi:hypothetical protein
MPPSGVFADSTASAAATRQSATLRIAYEPGGRSFCAWPRHTAHEPPRPRAEGGSVHGDEVDAP